MQFREAGASLHAWSPRWANKMKRHTLPLLLLLWAPVFLYAVDKTTGEDGIDKETMTASEVALNLGQVAVIV